MHYYQFNIGDYAKSTRHLNLMQDLAYRRLLDMYYDTSKPLISDVKKLSRLLGMSEFQSDVEVILDDFFDLSELGYSQKRVDEELACYQQKADMARVNGKKGGRPPKADRNPEETQSVNLANPEETELKAKHKPLTINQLKDMHDLVNQAALPVNQDYLEERTLAFNDFWMQWGDNKKMVGKVNTAPKSTVKTKFLNQTFPASKVRAMGVESFNEEVELMLDLAWNAHSDIAKHDKTKTESSWFNYRSMYPSKFLSNAQWRDQA